MTTTPGAHGSFLIEPCADLPELAAADRGRGLLPGSRPLREHQAYLLLPSGDCSTTGATRWGSRPSPPIPSPWPATWPPGPNSGTSIATLRLATSAISKAHQWAKQESPCRDPGVRASLKGMGTAPRQAPAPVRRPHRRRARRDPPHRRQQPRRRGRGIRDAGAGPGAGEV